MAPDAAPVRHLPPVAAPAPARGLPPVAFTVLAGVVFAVTMLKGARMPNLWACTHMTFNYSHGFIRRGLFGEIVRRIGGERLYTYNFYALLAVLMLVAVGTVVFLSIRRMLREDPGDAGVQAAVLVFGASPGLIFFTHEIGYFDYLGVLAVLTLALLSRLTSWRWPLFYVVAATCIVLALIHESLVLMFGPALLLFMSGHVVRSIRRGGVSRAGQAALWAHALGAIAVAFAASAFVGSRGTRSAALVLGLQESIQRTVSFPLRSDGFEALYRPVSDNLRTLMPGYWAVERHREYFWFGIMATFPGLAFMVQYGLRFLGRLGLPVLARVFMSATLVIAAVLPLSLNLMGWDSARWNAICTLSCFCSIVVLKLQFPPDQAAAGRTTRFDTWLDLTLAGVAVILGLATSNYWNFLFDGRVPQGYPFEEPLRQLIDLFKHNFTWIPGG